MQLPGKHGTLEILLISYGRNLLLLPASFNILVSIHQIIWESLIEFTDFSFGYKAEVFETKFRLVLVSVMVR